MTKTPKVEQSGNAAAMREALETLRQRFDNDTMAYQDRYLKFDGWHWHKKAKEAARWRDVFHELREVCDAALAAPVRNCDVVRDKNEALYRCRANVPVERDAAYDRGMQDAIDWLLGERKEPNHE